MLKAYGEHFVHYANAKFLINTELKESLSY